MKKILFVSTLTLVSCTGSPERIPLHSTSSDDAKGGSTNSPQNNPEMESNPNEESGAVKEDSTPKPVGTDETDMGKTPEETSAEKAQAEKAAALLKLERIPTGCSDKGTVTEKDFVLFNAEAIQYNASSKSIALNEGWKIDGSWGNGRIGVETKRGQPAITFDNETYYHGFDITPPSANGQRKTFTMSGFDVYYDSTRSSEGKFGLRIIKPGENEGAGDNEKRSWFKLDPSGAGADADVANSKVNTDCKLVRFYTTKTFVDQNKVANRFIWEFMPNWDPADKLFVYKIVLKDFQWK
ncbi:MAG: hypothetical protein EOP07_12545 [Proteobacteria bacterium]|nr:MAG: hypothetical protein EOP07_12545 [Pseudomonadota bacterium]